MKKKLSLIIILLIACIFTAKSQIPYFYSSPNSSAIYVGGGYWGNYLGYNALLEYRGKISESDFYYQPAIIAHGFISKSKYSDGNILQNNIEIAMNFTYSFAPLMNVSWLDYRMGLGLLGNVEFTPNVIGVDQNIKFIFGTAAYVGIDFMLTNNIGIGIRNQFDVYINSKSTIIKNILSIGLTYKIN